METLDNITKELKIINMETLDNITKELKIINMDKYKYMGVIAEKGNKIINACGAANANFQVTCSQWIKKFNLDELSEITCSTAQGYNSRNLNKKEKTCLLKNLIVFEQAKNNRIKNCENNYFDELISEEF